MSKRINIIIIHPCGSEKHHESPNNWSSAILKWRSENSNHVIWSKALAMILEKTIYNSQQQMREEKLQTLERVVKNLTRIRVFKNKCKRSMCRNRFWCFEMWKTFEWEQPRWCVSFCIKLQEKLLWRHRNFKWSSVKVRQLALVNGRICAFDGTWENDKNPVRQQLGMFSSFQQRFCA